MARLGNLSLDWLGEPGRSSGVPVVPSSFAVIAPHSTFVLLLMQINSANAFHFAGSLSHVPRANVRRRSSAPAVRLAIFSCQN